MTDRSKFEESIVRYAFDGADDDVADLAWDIARDDELLTYVCRLIEDSSILAAAAGLDADLPQCALRLEKLVADAMAIMAQAESIPVQ
jgi:hypothetical protein